MRITCATIALLLCSACESQTIDAPDDGKPGCTDGNKNGSETDIDCGGSCRPCGDGKTCAAASDCAAGTCTGGVCRAPSCTDATRNGSETDTDCGGSCQPCANAKGCLTPADCVSKICTASRCQTDCTDVLVGGEFDTWCGGSCSPCPDGRICRQASDCIGICDTGRCRTPKSCAELHAQKPSVGDGTVTIRVGSTPLTVHCDMTTAGGGWTVLPLRFADRALWSITDSGLSCTSAGAFDNNGSYLSYQNSSAASAWSIHAFKFVPALAVSEVRFESLSHSTASSYNNMDLTYQSTPIATGDASLEGWYFSAGTPTQLLMSVFNAQCNAPGYVANAGVSPYCNMNTVDTLTTITSSYTLPMTIPNFLMVAVQGCSSSFLNTTGMAERFLIQHPSGVNGVWTDGIKVR